MLNPIPHSQHRPIIIDVTAAVVPQKVPLRPRFNFRKANWEVFTSYIDEALTDLEPIPANYERFIKLIQGISKKHIPRGYREHYIPGISADSATIHDEYLKLYDQDPLSDDTLDAGEMLMAAMLRSEGNPGKNSSKVWT